MRCGCRCIGVDVRADCLEALQLGARRLGVCDLVRSVQLDMMTELETSEEWRCATVVYAYVMPHMNQDLRLQPVLRRAVSDGGKRIALYCTSGSRVRKPGAPEAGNRIGELAPVAQAALGMLRVYADASTVDRLPELGQVCAARELAGRQGGGVGERASKLGGSVGAATTAAAAMQRPSPALLSAVAAAVPQAVKMAHELSSTESSRSPMAGSRSPSLIWSSPVSRQAGRFQHTQALKTG